MSATQSLAPGLGSTISTETAVTLFGILGGVVMAVAQLLAAGKLSAVESDTISVSAMLPAVGAMGAGVLVASQLIPGG